jgi:YVTN family beta-propeller protein
MSAAIAIGASEYKSDASGRPSREATRANADSDTVTVVDTAARKALREIKVGDKPEGVAWINANLAAVTVYRADRVVFFNPETGAVVKSLTVSNEPYGIVTNKDRSRAWITQDYPGSVTEIDLKTLQIVREMKVGSFVRWRCYCWPSAVARPRRRSVPNLAPLPNRAVGALSDTGSESPMCIVPVLLGKIGVDGTVKVVCEVMQTKAASISLIDREHDELVRHRLQRPRSGRPHMQKDHAQQQTRLSFVNDQSNVAANTSGPEVLVF